MRVPPEAAKQPPTVLVKWYELLRWLLDRVDSFPKNQRFIFGTRLADRAIGVLELHHADASLLLVTVGSKPC